ncbi:MAG: lipocalin-like domain-containing protein [Hyphomicrobiales bacterium]|nr:lipocalin-like domain-containing protein [Hyphomicrobiales bacterium]
MATREDLIGTWELVEWTITYSDGRAPTLPYGEAPMGLITYGADGYMGAAIARAGRSALSHLNTRLAPKPEKAAAFDGYFHYAGTWRLEGDSVVHAVTLSLNPAFVGTDQVRRVELDGDGLTLSAEVTSASGATLRNAIRWRRAP